MKKVSLRSVIPVLERVLRRDADHRVDDIPRRDALAREDAVKVLRGDLTRPLSVPIRPSPLKVSSQIFISDPLALLARVQRLQDHIVDLEHVNLAHHGVRAPQGCLVREVCATLLDVLPDSLFLSHLLVIIVVRVDDSVPALLAAHVEEEHMLAEFAHVVRKGLLVGRDRELVQVAFEERQDLFVRPSYVTIELFIELQGELGNIRSHDALKDGVVLVVVVLVLFGHVSSAVHVSEGLRGLEQKIRRLGANVLRDFGPRLAALGPDRGLLLLLLLLGGLGIVPDLHLRGARDHGLGAQRVPQVVPSPRLPQPHDLGGRTAECISAPFPRLIPPHELLIPPRELGAP